MEGAFREARAARVAVVDEDRGQQGVGVQRDRDASDVPAVAGGEQRQHADRRVLGRVEGAAEDLRVDPGPVQLVLGDRPPHGAGAQRTGREVEFRLAEHFAGDDPPPKEGDDLVGDLDGAEAEASVAPGDLGVRLQDGDGRRVPGHRRPGRAGLLDQGDGVLQVEGADDVGAALVQMDRALVDAGVRRARVDRAQQPARPRLDDLDGAAALTADVGEVGGPLAAGPVPGPRPPAQQLRGLQLRQQLLGGGGRRGRGRPR